METAEVAVALEEGVTSGKHGWRQYKQRLGVKGTLSVWASVRPLFLLHLVDSDLRRVSSGFLVFQPVSQDKLCFPLLSGGRVALKHEAGETLAPQELKHHRPCQGGHYQPDEITLPSSEEGRDQWGLLRW